MNIVQLLCQSPNAFIVSHQMSDSRKPNLCRLADTLVAAAARALPRQQLDKDWESGLILLTLSLEAPAPPHQP